ncbi:MAG: trigger factor [Clostridia bacterium]|nr:trigger factor [Clostridia bacterium]
MSLKSTNKNGNQVDIEIAIDKESFDKAVEAAYRKNVKNMNVPGFRKGKAPRSVVEKMYGKGVFYDEAINALLPKAYDEAITECGETPVGQAEFDIVSLDDNGLVLKASFPVKPEVTVKEYKGYKVTRAVAPTTEEEVNAQIEQVRARNSRTVDITDRAAAEGDIAVIDYEGSVDGVPFEGGKGEKYNLTLGSGQFIPGFEEQIVGHNPGDAFDVNVTFPTEYHAAELAGKAAVFKTVLHEIKFNELPELDDEFAKDVSEFDTFDEYKKDVEAKITERHNAEADREVENKLIEKLIENLEADIPEAMFITETENQVRDYDNRLRMQGLDLNTYLKYTGMTLDNMREQFRPIAEKQVKTRLALEKIAELENIEVTEEEIEAELQKIADAYRIELSEVKAQITPDMITDDIKVSKAVEVVKANASITKPRKPRAKKAAPKAEEAAEEKTEEVTE